LASGDNLERVEITSAAQLREWLEAHYTQTESVWLVLYKKHTGDNYVPVPQILDEILCFGWIDGTARKLDDERSLRLISPRRTQLWAKTYKDRAARLQKEGRMHSAGLAAIADSKRLGLWNEMDDVDALIVPDDLISFLEAHPPTLDNFKAFAPSYRRNVLRWIKIAKTQETRAKRLEKTALLAAKNQKVPQL
jgi:uncharacterized protein YdeI (YjbR/CyaY-like superfamily)